MMFHSSPGLETFQEYCEYIKGLAQEGIIHWQTEWYRRLKSSNDSSSLISKVDEITKKLDNIQMRLGELSAAVGTTHSHQSHIQPSRLDQNSNENILWEPCSPLTSVVTEDGMSVVATPKGQQSCLPNVEAEPPNNAEPETTSMPIPQQWRKPSITLNKENFVSIVDQALDYTLKFESVISPNQGAILSATIDIYECLSHRQSRTASAQAMLLSKRRPEILWSCELVYLECSSSLLLT
ncbi:hypothetical protein FRC03_012783 [Tulasnella sp. 419]|nr:hypothetical protein FRC03_012783 [Tulasnella sp. 419]